MVNRPRRNPYGPPLSRPMSYATTNTPPLPNPAGALAQQHAQQRRAQAPQAQLAQQYAQQNQRPTGLPPAGPPLAPVGGWPQPAPPPPMAEQPVMSQQPDYAGPSLAPQPVVAPPAPPPPQQVGTVRVQPRVPQQPAPGPVVPGSTQVAVPGPMPMPPPPGMPEPWRSQQLARYQQAVQQATAQTPGGGMQVMTPRPPVPLVVGPGGVATHQPQPQPAPLPQPQVPQQPAWGMGNDFGSQILNMFLGQYGLSLPGIGGWGSYLQPAPPPPLAAPQPAPSVPEPVAVAPPPPVAAPEPAPAAAPAPPPPNLPPAVRAEIDAGRGWWAEQQRVAAESQERRDLARQVMSTPYSRQLNEREIWAMPLDELRATAAYMAPDRIPNARAGGPPPGSAPPQPMGMTIAPRPAPAPPEAPNRVSELLERIMSGWR